MFAPTSVNLKELVPILCRLLIKNLVFFLQNDFIWFPFPKNRLLNSSHFVLRKSCVACIRQFSQREAATVFWAATTEDIPQGVIQLQKQFGTPLLKSLKCFWNLTMKIFLRSSWNAFFSTWLWSWSLCFVWHSWHNYINNAFHGCWQTYFLVAFVSRGTSEIQDTRSKSYPFPPF